MNSTILTYDKIMENYDTSKNKSVKFLTIYEKTAIIGMRKQQLVNGAKTYLTDKKLDIMENINEIVELELKENKLPFMICRPFPNGNNEYWKLEDLIKF